MSAKNIFRCVTLIVAGIALVSIRATAQDAPSVAEAARRAREQKKEAPKPAKVIDNDSLPAKPATSTTDIATVPPPAEANAPSNATAAGTSDAEPADDATTQEERKKEIGGLKAQIAEKKEKINLAQREIALAQDTFLSNPDHERDTSGKEKLNTMQTDLTQQQAELSDLQAKLAQLGGTTPDKTPETPKP